MLSSFPMGVNFGQTNGWVYMQKGAVNPLGPTWLDSSGNQFQLFMNVGGQMNLLYTPQGGSQFTVLTVKSTGTGGWLVIPGSAGVYIDAGGAGGTQPLSLRATSVNITASNISIGSAGSTTAVQNLNVQGSCTGCGTTTPSSVVGHDAETGLAANFSYHTLYTPAQTGLFRASCVVLVTIAGTSGNLGCFVQYSNGIAVQAPAVGPNVPVATAGNDSSYGSGANSAVFHAAAGQPIQYGVNFNSVVGSPVYSVWITIEQLQ